MTDTNNYYWIGYTEDHHNGPNNRAGDSTTGTPYFTYDARFELNKVEAGVNTILANSTEHHSRFHPAHNHQKPVRSNG